MTMAETPRHPDIDFEKTDIAGTPVLRFVIALGISMALVGVLALVFYRRLASYIAQHQPPPPIMQFEDIRKPPLPRLQPHPVLDYTKVRAEETARLESYGWVDKDAGVVHIPVEQAMKIALERGLPASGPPPSPGAKPTPSPKPEEAKKE
jgi:hypothetical protein